MNDVTVAARDGRAVIDFGGLQLRSLRVDGPVSVHNVGFEDAAVPDGDPWWVASTCTLAGSPAYCGYHDGGLPVPCNGLDGGAERDRDAEVDAAVADVADGAARAVAALSAAVEGVLKVIAGAESKTGADRGVLHVSELRAALEPLAVRGGAG